MKLKSTIKCPQCGFEKEETMPQDACQYFYICSKCQKRIEPKPGDCCVYCSYGSVKCPMKQVK
ncbi:MAG: GDCCVxC domain-containing (seleno)protein [Candidatus Paceibacterota bacterium]